MKPNTLSSLVFGSKYKVYGFIPPLLSYLLFHFNLLLKGGSTGLDGLDLKLISAISPGSGGYFVELGANDGIRQSNTYKLQRKYGWTGLLIEPSPIRYRECVINRTWGNAPAVRCAACVPFGYAGRFVEIEDSDLMSTAKGLDVKDSDVVLHADSGINYLGNPSFRCTYAALAKTLSSLLDDVNAPFDFDLLSLDVEGNELSVLKGIDFSRYRPKWILVEVRHADIGDYLAQNGYCEHLRLSTNSQYSDILFGLL